jgi:hypothetical protein
MTRTNGHDAHGNGNPQQSPPAIYLSLIHALERRRVQLGLTLVQCDEAVGWSEGFASKAFYPDSPTHGRTMSWRTLEELCLALFPHGAHVRLIASDGTPARRGSLAGEPQGGRSLIRHYLQKIAANGGRASWAPLSAAERSARARRAAKVSAQRRREKLERDRKAIAAKRAQTQTQPRLGVGSVVVTLDRTP